MQCGGGCRVLFFLSLILIVALCCVRMCVPALCVSESELIGLRAAQQRLQAQRAATNSSDHAGAASRAHIPGAARLVHPPTASFSKSPVMSKSALFRSPLQAASIPAPATRVSVRLPAAQNISAELARAQESRRTEILQRTNDKR